MSTPPESHGKPHREPQPLTAPGERHYDDEYGTRLLASYAPTDRVRLTRVIVYEGPADWVAYSMNRATCQGVGMTKAFELPPGRQLYCIEETIERV